MNSVNLNFYGVKYFSVYKNYSEVANRLQNNFLGIDFMILVHY